MSDLVQIYTAMFPDGGAPRKGFDILNRLESLENMPQISLRIENGEPDKTRLVSFQNVVNNIRNYFERAESQNEYDR